MQLIVHDLRRILYIPAIMGAVMVAVALLLERLWQMYLTPARAVELVTLTRVDHA